MRGYLLCRQSPRRPRKKSDRSRPLLPDAVIAGPAFNAGRYGTACGAVCEAVGKNPEIPTVTGMYPENPGVDMYRKSTPYRQNADSARGSRRMPFP